MAEDLDLVIRNGTVVDGTGAEPFDADIAVAGGQIVEIGKIAAWAGLALILVTIFDVITRRFFVLGSTKLQEAEWHLHTILFVFCLGYAYMKDAHVRIDDAHERHVRKVEPLRDHLGAEQDVDLAARHLVEDRRADDAGQTIEKPPHRRRERPLEAGERAREVVVDMGPFAVPDMGLPDPHGSGSHGGHVSVSVWI